MGGIITETTDFPGITDHTEAAKVLDKPIALLTFPTTPMVEFLARQTRELAKWLRQKADDVEALTDEEKERYGKRFRAGLYCNP